jgi:hypothetical protein
MKKFNHVYWKLAFAALTIGALVAAAAAPINWR